MFNRPIPAGLAAAWDSTDIQNLGIMLGDQDPLTGAASSYLQQIRDSLGLFFVPPSNWQVYSVNIDTIENFVTALTEFFNTGGASVVIYQGPVTDQNGTQCYLIIWA